MAYLDEINSDTNAYIVVAVISLCIGVLMLVLLELKPSRLIEELESWIKHELRGERIRKTMKLLPT